PSWINRDLPRGQEGRFTETRPGLFFHPGRASDPAVAEELVALAARFAPPAPVEIQNSDGYFITLYRGGGALTAHLLATDYDVHVDETLDGMRRHRSRVNYIDGARPLGLSRTLRVRSDRAPEVYLPLTEGAAAVKAEAGGWTVSLPEDASYVILRFPDA
ncbi:MAG: hypothetical protein II776_07825, partial [Clostridia bacterium]|nr:hypothetical protein [Clostridia bacterium]